MSHKHISIGTANKYIRRARYRLACRLDTRGIPIIIPNKLIIFFTYAKNINDRVRVCCTDGSLTHAHVRKSLTRAHMLLMMKHSPAARRARPREWFIEIHTNIHAKLKYTITRHETGARHMQKQVRVCSVFHRHTHTPRRADIFIACRLSL